MTNEQNFDKWIPIGTYTQPYTGTFDGKEFTIKGLYFNDAKVDNVGLFGYVGKKGVVSNVSVSDFYLKGKAAVGSVCGYNSAGGTIGGSCLTGKVSGEDYVGGVCGRNDGTVINSYSTAEVCDGNYIGGICGYNYAGGTISNSYNTGLVSGRQKVGGVCGSNSGTVCNSYSLKTQNGYDTVGVNDGFNGAEIKTANRFASGEIAYLLAQAAALEKEQMRYVMKELSGDRPFPAMEKRVILC